MNSMDLLCTFDELNERFEAHWFTAKESGKKLEVLEELVSKEYLIRENDLYQIKNAETYLELEREICGNEGLFLNQELLSRNLAVRAL